MKKLAIALLCLLVFQACSNFHVEKRRYRKGFHISWNKNKKSDSKAKDEALKLSKDESPTLFSESNELESVRENPELSEVQEEILDIADKKKQELTLIDEIEDRASIPVNSVHTKDVKTVSQKTRNSTKNSNKSKWLASLLFFTLALFLPMSFILPFFNRTSIWASKNVNKARWIIAGLQIALLFITMGLGALMGVTIAPWMLFIGLGGVIIATIAYFLTHNSETNRRKKRLFSMNLFNVSSAFSGFALGANGFLSHPHKLLEWQLSSGVSDVEPTNGFVVSNWALILLTILLIALLIGALIVLAGVACNLSCGGQEVLAAVVFFGGIFIIFLGFFYAMFYLFRRANDESKKLFLRALLIASIIAAAVGIIVAVPALLA